MSSLLVDHIGLLATCTPGLGAGPLGTLSDAAVIIDEGTVAYVGPSAGAAAADEVLDAGGRCVVPGFVDSHTHLVFAGDRGEEFAARMAGAPYAAGGIRTTVAATRLASDEELFERAEGLAAEALSSGTTTMEIKSGYGLTVADEARLLAVATRLTTEVTFLGAHVVPDGGDPDAYVDLVVGPMLDACAPLARWADVFCDRGAFTGEQSRRVLQAAAARGLGLRLHAAQLQPGPGVELACELGAASADHLTYLTGADIDALAAADTVATLLPAAEFSTRHPYPDARALLDAGATVALASDCNPGTSFTTNMPFVVALAVRDMLMTVEEALLAATTGGAQALRRSDIGRIAPGCSGDLAVLDAPHPSWLTYRPGVAIIRAVVRAGAVVSRAQALPAGRRP